VQQILVYADSLTGGIIPDTRQRLPLEQRWPDQHLVLAQSGRHGELGEEGLAVGGGEAAGEQQEGQQDARRVCVSR
jgi:hypothetical protein